MSTGLPGQLEQAWTTFTPCGVLYPCHVHTSAIRAWLGGAGQSLNSYGIAGLMGESHTFVDMNIYYSDDEMRKQGSD
eukprot:2762808-Amphidinium_carterae.1